MKKPVIIGIPCHKGGVGKTATVAALADVGGHPSVGKRVLIIDADEQSCQKTIFAVKMHQSEGGLASVLTGKAALKDVVSHVRPNIDLLLSGGRHLRDFEKIASRAENGALLMSHAFNGQLDSYDYVFVDCPPHISELTVAIIAFCDYLIIPCKLDLLGFAGMKQTIGFYEHLLKDLVRMKVPFARLLGCVPTMYATRRSVDTAIALDLDTMLDNQLIPRLYSPIPKDAKVTMAQIKRKLLSEGYQNSKAALAYQKLFKEILEDVAKLEAADVA